MGADAQGTARARDAGLGQGFIDWFTVIRASGRDIDLGYYRHWVDPTRPFIASLTESSQGFAITSATLRDGGMPATGSPRTDASGAIHLPTQPVRLTVRSPFDYTANTKLLIVNDVERGSMEQIAGAYRALFEASGGGALACSPRSLAACRPSTHRSAARQLGLDLLSQHIDPMDHGDAGGPFPR